LVDDVMHKANQIPLATPDLSLPDVLVEITQKGFGCLGIIGSDKKLIGIITDGDLRRHMSADLLNKKASDIMTANPRSISRDSMAAEALQTMNQDSIQCLFVCEDGKPVGLIRVLDLLRIGTA